MREKLALLLVAGAMLSLVGEASAENRHGAPITYATGSSSASPVQLAGGAETSYGYGAAPQAPGPVIDLRRNAPRQTQTQAPAPTQTASSAAPAGQGTPNWLEHERVGPPYQANGQWYVPTAQPGYSESGTASWYGPNFHGQPTATGETYDQEAMTAAHPTLPIPSLVQVTNLQNGREVILRVTDRGPFVGNRVIDVSHKAAEVLGFDRTGTARVNVRYLGPAPRRVAADGSSLPASAPSPQPMAPAAPQVMADAGAPVSLLPPHTDAPNAPELAQTQPVSYTPPAPPVAVSAATAASGNYMVQVGAYSDLLHAQNVASALHSAGPSAVDVRQTASGELYRVRLGPFTTREEADAARRSAAGLGYGDAVLAAR